MMENFNWKNLDLEMIQGRYIHFGHFIEGLSKSIKNTFADFYSELIRLHCAIFIEFYKEPELFNSIKIALLYSLQQVRKTIRLITPENMKEMFEEMTKDKSTVKDLVNFFQKSDYFV